MKSLMVSETRIGVCEFGNQRLVPGCERGDEQIARVDYANFDKEAELYSW